MIFYISDDTKELTVKGEGLSGYSARPLPSQITVQPHPPPQNKVNIPSGLSRKNESEPRSIAFLLQSMKNSFQ
jgi:hypothetical protein